MNLKCALCKEEAVRDCKIVKNLICEGCCEYEMREDGAPEYVQQRTGIQMTWTTIINTCSTCKYR